jgi:hypothetical protein
VAAFEALGDTDLQMLLDGVDLESVQRSRRYRRPKPA